MSEKSSIDNKEKEKTESSLATNVYTYTPGEYDVLADTTLEEKIEEFRKKIDELDECYKELNKRLEALSGDEGLWKSVHQKELYSYVKGSVVDTFPKRIDDWKTYREFLITVLQSYTDFDETYNTTIDESKDNLDVNESKES